MKCCAGDKNRISEERNDFENSICEVGVKLRSRTRGNLGHYLSICFLIACIHFAASGTSLIW